MGSKTLKVKPAENDEGPLIVRDPMTGAKLAPDVYTEVEANSYWRRRIRDGSVLQEPVVEDQPSGTRRPERGGSTLEVNSPAKKSGTTKERD